MKIRIPFALLTLVCFLFAVWDHAGARRAVAIRKQAFTISAADTNPRSTSPILGSFISRPMVPGGNLVTVVIPYGSTWSGTLAVEIQEPGGTRTPPIATASIINQADGTTGITSGATGTWTVTLGGAGSAVLVATAWVSGGINPVMTVGPGSLGGGGSGGGGGGVVTGAGGAALGLDSSLQSVLAAQVVTNNYLANPLMVSGQGAANTSLSQLVTGTVPASNATAVTTYVNGSAITSAVTVDASTGNLYNYTACNTSASTVYFVEFFNAASGSVTLGTTVPIWFAPVPPGGITEHFNVPVPFASALSVAFVQTPFGNTLAPSATTYCAIGYK